MAAPFALRSAVELGDHEIGSSSGASHTPSGIRTTSPRSSISRRNRYKGQASVVVRGTPLVLEPLGDSEEAEGNRDAVVIGAGVRDAWQEAIPDCSVEQPGVGPPPDVVAVLREAAIGKG